MLLLRIQSPAYQVPAVEQFFADLNTFFFTVTDGALITATIIVMVK